MNFKFIKIKFGSPYKKNVGTKNNHTDNLSPITYLLSPILNKRFERFFDNFQTLFYLRFGNDERRC